MSKTLVTLVVSTPALQKAFEARKRLGVNLRDDGFIPTSSTSSSNSSSTAAALNRSSSSSNSTHNDDALLLLKSQLDDLRSRHSAELERLSQEREKISSSSASAHEERVGALQRDHVTQLTSLQRDHAAQISTLRKERDDEVHRIRSEMQALESNLREGKSDLEGSARRQRDAFEAELSALKSERDSLEKRLLNLQDEVSVASLKASASSKQVEDLSSQLLKVSSEKTEARTLLDAALRTSSSHEQTAENLSSRLRILEAELNSSRQAASSELSSKDEAANMAKKAMEEEMESLRASLVSSRKLEAAEKSKSLELIQGYDRERVVFESKINGLSLSLDQSRAELTVSRSHILELEELLSKSHASEKASRLENEKSLAAITSLGVEMETAKSLFAREKGVLNDDLSSSKRDIQRLNEEKSLIEEQLSKQVTMTRSLEEQLSKQVTLTMSLEDRLETQVKALQLKLDSETEAKSRLESQLGVKSNEFDSLKMRFENSQGEISSLSSEALKMTEKATSLSASLQTETSRVHIEMNRSAKLVEDLQAEQDKSTQLDRALQQCRKELEIEVEKSKDVQKNSEALQRTTVNEYESNIAALKARLEQARNDSDAQISSLQGQVKKAEEEVEEKVTKIKVLSDEVNVLKNETIKELSDEINSLKNGTIKDLSDEINTLKKSLDRSSTLATNQAIEIEEALSDKQAAQEKVSQLEATLVTIKAEHASALAAVHAENASALEALKAESAAALASTSEVLNKKLQVVVKEFKALRQARESDESARQLAVASATDTRIACERLKTRLRASEDAVNEATKAAKESSERCAMFETELKQVRVSLRESQAAREFAEEKSSRAEREALDLKTKVEFDEKAKDVASVWNEVNVTEPAPRMTIDDPAVGLILQSLTSSGGSGSSDDARLQDLWGWFKGVSNEKDVGKVLKSKPKLELERVPFDVRANLLTLLVPLLKAKTHVDVKVYMRERQEVRSDIRLVVEDKRFIGDVKDAVNAGKTMAKEWRSNG